MEILAISFPIEYYSDRSKLDLLYGNELLQLAEKDQHCTIETLGQFQQDLNNNFIDTESSWWYFVNKSNNLKTN